MSVHGGSLFYGDYIVLQRDLQATELIEVADYLVYALLRIPDKAESELTGFAAQELYLDIVVGSYLRQHLRQRDIVVDDRLHGECVVAERIGWSHIYGRCVIDDYFCLG